MRKLVWPLLLLGLAATLASAVPAYGAAVTIQSNVQAPFELDIFIPCANAGIGEEVVLSGTIHFLFNITFDDAGHIHLKSSGQPQGVSGHGLTTGDLYRATGATEQTFVGFEPNVDTFVNNFRMIGQGPGNNFLVHQIVHATVTVNGDVTAVITASSVECK